MSQSRKDGKIPPRAEPSHFQPFAFHVLILDFGLSRQSQRDCIIQPNGYGIFSLGFPRIKEVRDYIAAQEAHHRQASFQEEFGTLLRHYDVAFDERYVLD